VEVLENHFPSLSLSVATNTYFPPSPLLRSAKVVIGEAQLCGKENTLHQIQNSIQGSPNLISLEWSFHYTGCTVCSNRLEPFLFTAAPGVFPPLEELKIHGHRFNPLDMDYWVAAMDWTKLKVLDLGEHVPLQPLLTGLTPAAKLLPSLEKLRIVLPKDDSDLGTLVDFLSSGRDSLIELELDGRYHSIVTALLSEAGPGLKRLTLHGPEPTDGPDQRNMLTAKQLSKISTHYPQLEHLSIDFDIFANYTWVSVI
jgi:hypothetical protein